MCNRFEWKRSKKKSRKASSKFLGVAQSKEISQNLKRVIELHDQVIIGVKKEIISIR